MPGSADATYFIPNVCSSFLILTVKKLLKLSTVTKDIAKIKVAKWRQFFWITVYINNFWFNVTLIFVIKFTLTGKTDTGKIIKPFPKIPVG